MAISNACVDEKIGHEFVQDEDCRRAWAWEGENGDSRAETACWVWLEDDPGSGVQTHGWGSWSSS